MVLAALSQRIQAQNIIAEIPDKISKESIVREYDRYNFIVYNNEGGGHNSFNLIDFSTNVCHTMYLFLQHCPVLISNLLPTRRF